MTKTRILFLSLIMLAVAGCNVVVLPQHHSYRPYYSHYNSHYNNHYNSHYYRGHPRHYRPRYRRHGRY